MRVKRAGKTAFWDAILDWLSRNFPASKSQTGSFKVLAV
jgi:hypothetical protein